MNSPRQIPGTSRRPCPRSSPHLKSQPSHPSTRPLYNNWTLHVDMLLRGCLVHRLHAVTHGCAEGNRALVIPTSRAHRGHTGPPPPQFAGNEPSVCFSLGRGRILYPPSFRGDLLVMSFRPVRTIPQGRTVSKYDIVWPICIPQVFL